MSFLSTKVSVSSHGERMAVREFTPAQDWTADGAKTLNLWFRGDVVFFAETAPGVITLSATGTDIWSNSDEFRYTCKRLSGDGAIMARVASIVHTGTWAKAGVLIRETRAAMAFLPSGSSQTIRRKVQ